MKALAAEVVRNFSSRLSSLNIQVKELTGDMQLTKTEIVQTQVWYFLSDKTFYLTYISDDNYLLFSILPEFTIISMLLWKTKSIKLFFFLNATFSK